MFAPSNIVEEIVPFGNESWIVSRMSMLEGSFGVCLCRRLA